MWQRNEDSQVTRGNLAGVRGSSILHSPEREKGTEYPFRPPIGINPLSYPQSCSRKDTPSQGDLLTQKTFIHMESGTQSCTPAPDRITQRHCHSMSAKDGVGRELELKLDGLVCPERGDSLGNISLCHIRIGYQGVLAEILA